MIEGKVFEGKSIEEALEIASKELNIPLKDIKYEIVEEGAKGFLGVFSKKAKIKVILGEGETNQVKEKINELLENELKFDLKENEETKFVEEKENVNDDEVIEKIKDFIREIFGFFDISINIEVRKRRNNSINLSIFTKGAQIPAKNLEEFILALQFLVNKLANVKLKSGLFFNVDINEFMAKKIDRLKNLAIEISKKVRKEGKSYTLKPMMPQDRRIIHLALKNNKFVKTESKGDGDKKRIIISPSQPKMR